MSEQPQRRTRARGALPRGAGALGIALAANLSLIAFIWALQLDLDPAGSAPPPHPTLVTISRLARPTPTQPAPRSSARPPSVDVPEEIEIDLDAPQLPDFALEPLPVPALEFSTPDLPSLPVFAAPATERPGPRPAQARGSGATGSEGDPMQTGDELTASGIDEPPRERPGNRKPEYPIHLRRRGVEGVVHARLHIDEKGDVTEVRIVDGHPTFGAKVEATVSHWKYTIPRHQGRPVAVWANTTFRFVLEDE